MGRVAEIVRKEFEELLPAAVFFLALFHLVSLTRTLILEDYEITPGRAALSTILALTVAKAVLLVGALPVSRRFDRAPLFAPVLWKTLLFTFVTLFFHYLEDLIPLIFKTGGFGAANRRLAEEWDPARFWIIQLWLTAGLLMFTLVSELVRAQGGHRLRDVLGRPAAGGGAAPPR